VQQNFGYTATLAGLVLTPGGVVTVFMMPLVGRLTSKVQPRYLIAVAAAICAYAMYNMTKVNGDLGFWFFATSRIYIGIGLPLVFLPIIAASYDGIAPNKTDMASALINAARNIGGSIGISLANNVLAHREQFHQSRLVELANPTTTQCQDRLKQLMDYFTAHGSSLAQAQQQAFAWIGQQMQAQAAFLPYVDVFWTLAWSRSRRFRSRSSCAG
jgi:MFS transporter, DHA2 family, multidrug resistance protein